MKLKILSLLNTFQTSLSAIFLIFDFGLSQEASAYLLTNNLFYSSQLICELFTEHFIYRYGQLKQKSLFKAKVFYTNYLFIAFAISLLLVIFFYFSLNLIIYLFLNNLNSFELNLCKSYLYVLIPFIFFFLPSNLSRYYMVANNKLEISFLYVILPSLFLLIGFIYNHFFYIGIYNILIFYVLFSSITFLALIIYTKPVFFKFKYENFNEVLIAINKSFKLKMAHNIHNIGLTLIISNLVSSFSTDYRSLFLYSKKASDAIEHIIYIPNMKNFLSLIGSINFRRKPLIFKKEAIRNFKSSMFFISILLILVTIGYSILAYILKLKINYLSYTYIVFIILIFKTFFIIRAIPWEIFLIQNEKFLFFYKLNLTFLICIIILEKILYQFQNFSLPIAIMISQIIISTISIKNSKNLLNKITKN